METKICIKCGRELPLSEFYKHKGRKDGYFTYCKECLKTIRNNSLYRAKGLLQAYNKEDIKRGRGKGDLTAQWIIDNIFSKPCVHCGKEGWQVIGCNRLDNSKPHTKDNVEPCCFECNIKLAAIESSKSNYANQFKKKHTKNSWWK